MVHYRTPLEIFACTCLFPLLLDLGTHVHICPDLQHWLFLNFYIGPQQNEIARTLKKVDWESLANQLHVENEISSIYEPCKNNEDPASCRSRKILKIFMDNQDNESCQKTVEKIASAVEEIHQSNQASQLKRLCSPN